MTRDEIIQMAYQCGWGDLNDEGMEPLDPEDEVVDNLVQLVMLAYAAGHKDGQREMRERASKACETLAQLKDQDSLTERRTAYRAVECSYAIEQLEIREPS